jgi:hypothetical protein
MPIRLRVFLALLFVVALHSQRIGSSVVAAENNKLSFNRDIRPILSDACFQCHGPDEKQRKSGLRLDVRAQAIQASESGATAIVPGQVDASELIKRVLTTDTDLRMPPANSGKKITPQQITLLKRWIIEGAEYQGHWAFIPPTRPAIPSTKKSAWAKTPIDHFILARLERDDLQPADEADKITLIRRATLDLTGLPPTLTEIDAFVSDTSPQAYEKVIDRLLASPRYGEVMALRWLDYARYADSNGFQVDSSRFQWPWRDWVINAYNKNLPFDQFTVEQLAGDMLPNATRDQIIATGFNRNHRLNGEGGIIAEEWRVETVIDRVETTGSTWLGLTLNCCRCHDHKYDPITQKEFYGLFAFFNNVAESGTLQGESKNTDPTVAVTTPEFDAKLANADVAIKAAEAKVAETTKQLPEFVAAWEPGFKAKLSETTAVWRVLDATEVKSLGGAVLTKQADGTYLASGLNPNSDTYQIVAPLEAGSFTGLLLECLPDPSLPNESLGRFSNGNFVLSAVDAQVSSPNLKAPLVAKFKTAEASYSQQGWNIKLVIDRNPGQGWAVDGPTNRDPKKAMFLVDAPITVPENATLTVQLKHSAINGHNIGRFRLSATSLPPTTVKLDGVQIPDTLKTILALDAGQRSAAQKTELEKFFRANADSPLKQAELALAEAKKQRDELNKNLPTVMVMREGTPRDAFVLVRGQYDKRGDKVGAALPAMLPPLPAGESLNRLGLARWIASPQNPLTARVWVNRIWEKYFGAGLVKTTENLGSQSEYPSHPDLLDWLAVEFAEGSVDGSRRAWDMKAIQKQIVMSATYRQSSRSSQQPAIASKLAMLDPDNRLLSHGPRVRLQGELLRDQALAVSGLLVHKIGGASVRPYMPDGIWDETSRYGDLRNYKHEVGEGLYRRSLYTIWKRTAAPPSMLLFDAPSREICTVKRSRTNTPLQALALLNEVTFVEAARKLGERILLEGGTTTDSRLAFGFRVCLGRQPSAGELAVLNAGLESDLGRFKAQPEAAKQINGYGDSKSAEKLDPQELAAWTLTANVLLNLDEFVTRE